MFTVLSSLLKRFDKTLCIDLSLVPNNLEAVGTSNILSGYFVHNLTKSLSPNISPINAILFKKKEIYKGYL